MISRVACETEQRGYCQHSGTVSNTVNRKFLYGPVV